MNPAGDEALQAFVRVTRSSDGVPQAPYHRTVLHTSAELTGGLVAQHTSPCLDFVVIGAQKGGTTALWQLLRDHPQLWLPPNKEAPYFSHTEEVCCRFG